MELRTQTAEAIDKIASAIARTKPYKVIPLPARYFHKSALGKLSRAKMRKAFEEGQYDFEIQLNESGIHSFRVATRRSPSNAAEEAVLEIICERLGLLADEVSTSSNIFHLGFTSLDFFSFIQSLRSRVPNARNLDLADILWDPTITGVARAIDSKASPDDLYNPVVPLQTSGSKTPLWLVHPASGNVLAFALLANCFTHERPVYGLRCSGVKPGERFFSSIAEIAATYAAAIRRTQPQGPYAIAGYSLGSSIAFEIAKLLEADGQRIAFLGVLDSPPHIAPLVGQLTWSAGLVMVSFFYELIPERYANDIIPQLWHAEPAAALDFIMANSDPKRLKALALDREALSHVADVTANFSSACAKNYAPEGKVGGPVDVFVVDPLLSITDGRKRWVDEYLVHWRDFVRVEGGGLKFHQCEGSHSDMLGEKYIRSFQKTLKGVLAERGM
jgi:thioesterase domain-containing protein